MNTRFPYSLRKLLGFYSLWWVFWALIQTMVLHRLQLSWYVSSVDAVASNILLALAGFALTMIYRFYQPGTTNRIYRLVFAVVITYLFCITLHCLLGYIFAGDAAYQNFLDRSMPVRFIFSFMIISFITVMNWLWNLLVVQKENEKRKSDSEQLMKEAELTKLRQQLQPHFLFNSLNSISALVVTKPVEARKMVQQLSDFLRGTLKKEDQLVQFSEELEHLKLYLDIEKVRFGHRLNVEFAVSEESLHYRLPSLLLQPIVENAIKFGLYDVTGDIVISISASVAAPYLNIEIKNPFDSETKKSSEGVGFGLSSVQRRLYLLYSRNDLLMTEKRENIFITTLKIPASE